MRPQGTHFGSSERGYACMSGIRDRTCEASCDASTAIVDGFCTARPPTLLPGTGGIRFHRMSQVRGNPCQTRDGFRFCALLRHIHAALGPVVLAHTRYSVPATHDQARSGCKTPGCCVLRFPGAVRRSPCCLRTGPTLAVEYVSDKRAAARYCHDFCLRRSDRRKKRRFCTGHCATVAYGAACCANRNGIRYRGRYTSSGGRPGRPLPARTPPCAALSEERTPPRMSGQAAERLVCVCQSTVCALAGSDGYERLGPLTATQQKASERRSLRHGMSGCGDERIRGRPEVGPSVPGCAQRARPARHWHTDRSARGNGHTSHTRTRQGRPDPDITRCNRLFVSDISGFRGTNCECWGHCCACRHSTRSVSGKRTPHLVTHVHRSAMRCRNAERVVYSIRGFRGGNTGKRFPYTVWSLVRRGLLCVVDVFAGQRALRVP